jgi:hypothetical protein
MGMLCNSIRAVAMVSAPAEEAQAPAGRAILNLTSSVDLGRAPVSEATAPAAVSRRETDVAPYDLTAIVRHVRQIGLGFVAAPESLHNAHFLALILDPGFRSSGQRRPNFGERPARLAEARVIFTLSAAG